MKIYSVRAKLALYNKYSFYLSIVFLDPEGNIKISLFPAQLARKMLIKNLIFFYSLKDQGVNNIFFFFKSWAIVDFYPNYFFNQILKIYSGFTKVK